jgi:DNA polymerase III alpha subunit (gram-positive type)
MWSWLRRIVLHGRRRAGSPAQRLAEMRFVVLDIDVTGISLRRDRVTGIAALPVTAATFRLSDLRYCALANLPGASVQAGSDWRSNYTSLRNMVTGSSIVTYNPDFVMQMISRTCRVVGLPAIDGDWIDLVSMAGVVDAAASELTTMGYWLEKMKSGGWRPHDATYDVVTMAQMLQAILAYCDEAGIETAESLARNEDAQVWLRGG